MYINFRQGIITYPVTGNLQSFLVSSGIYVTLYAANGRTDVAFAHGSEDYLLSETSTIQDAWGPLPASTDCWLYWDIDKRTAVRTFGFTTVAPVYGEDPPTSPSEGLHWFDTINEVMFVYMNGGFREVIRVFAAKFNNSVFTPVGYGTAARPYAGSQVQLSDRQVRIGTILFDSTGSPIRRSNGRFFTTEQDIFTNGSNVNLLRLESVVLTGTSPTENLHAYQIITLSNFGEFSHATYNDIQTNAIGILLEDTLRYDTGSICLQGHVTNPDWNWTVAGAPLWVDDTGTLIEYDPHVTSPLTHPIGKTPVARVITQHSIMFDQGLGGKGETGSGGSVVGVATTTDLGVVKLTSAPANAESPIVVSDTDPRLTDAREPISHTQAATTVIPTPYGSLTGANLQLMLQQVEDSKVAKAGDTMTGMLTLPGSPTQPLHAATKQYVDAIDLSSRVAKAGDTMTGYLTLLGDPVSANHAATKHYVDALAQGLAVKPAVKAATTSDIGGTYNNGTQGVGASLTLPPAAILDVDGVVLWVLGDGVLVKDQLNPFENGRYYVSQVGGASTEWVLTRCGYCDEAHEIPSSYVFVQGGDTQSGTGWVAQVTVALGASSVDFEVGEDNITFVQFSGEGTYAAGYGLTLSGNVFSVTDINIPYDIAFFVPDNPFIPSSTVSGMLLGRDVYVDVNSPSAFLASCKTPPLSVAGATFDIFVNESQVATVTFAQSSTSGSVAWIPTSPFTVTRGDTITLRTTATTDGDITGIGVTITGCAIASPCSVRSGGG